MQKNFNVLFENIMSRLQNAGYDGGDFVIVDKSVLKHPMFQNAGEQLKARLADYVNTKNRLKISIVKSAQRPSISYTVDPENPVGTLVDVVEELAPGLWQNPITLPVECIKKVDAEGGNLTPEIPKNWKKESNDGKIKKNDNDSSRMMPTKNIQIPVGKSYDPVKTLKKKVSKESVDIYLESMMRMEGVPIVETALIEEGEESSDEYDEMDAALADAQKISEPITPSVKQDSVPTVDNSGAIKTQLENFVKKIIKQPMSSFEVLKDEDNQNSKTRAFQVSGTTELQGFEKPFNFDLNLKKDNNSISIMGKFFDKDGRERRIQQQGWNDMEISPSTSSVSPEDESEVKQSSLTMAGDVQKSSEASESDDSDMDYDPTWAGDIPEYKDEPEAGDDIEKTDEPVDLGYDDTLEPELKDQVEKDYSDKLEGINILQRVKSYTPKQKEYMRYLLA